MVECESGAEVPDVVDGGIRTVTANAQHIVCKAVHSLLASLRQNLFDFREDRKLQVVALQVQQSVGIFSVIRPRLTEKVG